jgi:Xaa-Pro dipeptidase
MVEFERRLRKLRQRMAERDLDAMLVTTPENICYLTGFESPGHYYFNALIVPMDSEPFMTPRMLEDSGVDALTWIEITRPYHDFQNPIEVLYQTLQEFNLHDKRIGFEKQCWFFTATQQENLFALAKSAEFVDCSLIVEAGRVIKSDYEIELMRKAARATEAGMQAGIDAVQAGVTEHDIAADMHYAMIKAGSEWPSIAPFVASGYRGAIGHATWTQRVIEKGDIIMLELGGCLKRYHTAMMRTGFIGEPGEEVRTAEQTVLEAFDAMREAIKPGVAAGDVDAASRKIIAKRLKGVSQASRSAYSIGIALPPDWGEGYILSMQPHEARELRPNMTFHMLPWVQVPGKGGVSISDTIRVTETGCELLTNFKRAIFVR